MLPENLLYINGIKFLSSQGIGSCAVYHIFPAIIKHQIYRLLLYVNSINIFHKNLLLSRFEYFQIVLLQGDLYPR